MQESVRSAQMKLKNCLKVVQHYSWLLESYVLDYFVDDHWEKLPLSWQLCFQDMDPTDLGHILAGVAPKTILPLSFLALLKTVNCLSLAREPNIQISITRNDVSRISAKEFHSAVTLDKSHIRDYTCGDHPKLQNLFLKHVKAKKRHEITVMCGAVVHAAHESSCTAAVDLGSGVGHLVRSLSYRHGIRTAGVERQATLTEEARKLDLELEYTASKHLSEDAMKLLKRPLHVNFSISPDTSFEMLGLPEYMREYGVVGLHPCGDLGPFLLRHFADSPRVRFICVVGCCYMKLSCGDGRGDCGYPMSSYLATSDSPCHLSYVSREISCHAIETYVDRLRRGNYHDLQVHAYRAALEAILVGVDRRLKHSAVRSIKHTNTLSFERYCTLSVERLGVSVPPEDIHSELTRQRLDRWRQVVIFYTLRLAVAPLVETVILLDRVLFLLERGLRCEIRPVFDPRLSPRNHIIVGIKL